MYFQSLQPQQPLSIVEKQYETGMCEPLHSHVCHQLIIVKHGFIRVTTPTGQLTQPSWWKYLLLSKLFGIWLLAFLWRDKMNDKYVYSAIMSMLSILAGIIIMSAVAIIY